MNDIWIEVTEKPADISIGFFRAIFRPLPGQIDVGQTVIQFNLTAYIKHMIEESKKS